MKKLNKIEKKFLSTVNNLHKIHTIQTLYIEVTRLQHAFSTFSKGQENGRRTGRRLEGCVNDWRGDHSAPKNWSVINLRRNVSSRNTLHTAGLATVLKWPTSSARNWNITRFSTSLESACINTCLLLSNCF